MLYVFVVETLLWVILAVSSSHVRKKDKMLFINMSVKLCTWTTSREVARTETSNTLKEKMHSPPPPTQHKAESIHES